jgi:hypothetical protein
MTLAQAIQHAEKRARETDEVRYVVYESGEYHIATEEDLDTFFMGISDRNILYCTSYSNSRGIL